MSNPHFQVYIVNPWAGIDVLQTTVAEARQWSGNCAPFSLRLRSVRLLSQTMNRLQTPTRRLARAVAPALFALLLAVPVHAHASLFEGETLDAVANGISWVAIVIAPIIGITIFWLLHVMPEKIAEKKKHPQTHAIHCLCLLSLFFGGLLWPIAWLWAYTKPVLHKLAYGTDVDESLEHHGKEPPAVSEVDQLRARVAELETQLNEGKA